MVRWFAFVAALLLVAAPAGAQELQTCRQGATCSCDALVDRDGVLNLTHCDAWRVKEILSGYAEGSARLLPERVEPLDLDVARRKQETLRRDAVDALLQLMTREQLENLFPPLMPTDGSRPPGPTRPGDWPHGTFSDCDKAVYWINQALFKMNDVDSKLVQFGVEMAQYPLNPPGLCNPELIANAPLYLNSQTAYLEARQWLQLAADAMSNGMPVVAAIDSFIGWWRAGWAGFGFVVAYSYPPISNDTRCSEVADLGMLLAPVAQAAQQGYEWAKECAGTGGFWF